MIKVLAYFLLHLALNCQISLEQVTNGAPLPPPLPPPPPSLPPPPPPPQLPNEEVFAVNQLLQLLSPYSSLRTSYFSSLGCQNYRFTPEIQCNCRLGNTCRVVGIDLSGQGLSGYIPREIGDLTLLESLIGIQEP